MKKTKTCTVTAVTQIYFYEDEIAEMILKQSGLVGGDVKFDDSTYGGINGCWVTQKTTEEKNIDGEAA